MSLDPFSSLKYPDPLNESLQDILLHFNNGVMKTKDLGDKLNSLYVSQSDNAELKKRLNNSFSFYSTIDGHSGLSNQCLFPYLDTSGNKVNNLSSVISSIPGESNNYSDCVVMCRSPYTSYEIRDSAAVEAFLNSIPTTFMSMCAPYLSVEFVFERLGSDLPSIQTSSQFKFLLGGKSRNDLSSFDQKLYDSELSRSDNDGTISSVSGMELFTSPQTLLNLSSDSPLRYNEISDPMRPFATLESVKISTKGTTGVMSYKTATMTIKIHDKSRLAEMSDFIQPTKYGRATVWLTYGWRFPESELKGTNPIGEFINRKMMIREAYSVYNSNFSFSGNESVTLNLSLSTKSFFEISRNTLQKETEGFEKFKKSQEELSKTIKGLYTDLRLDKLYDGKKEIRPFVVLESAANNSPNINLKYSEINNAISDLNKALKRGLIDDKNKVDNLIATLKSYFIDPKLNKVAYDEALKNNFNDYMEKKLLSLGKNDVFLFSQHKNNELNKDFGIAQGSFPYEQELKKFTSESQSIKGVPSVVSLGKLLSVMMIPSLRKIEGVKDVQLFFYNLNNQAGLAAGTNYAEFPIDLPYFVEKLEEYSKSFGSINFTIEQFVEIISNTQISDLRAIPYGFRSLQNELFTKRSRKPEESSATAVKEKQEANFQSLSLKLNQGRGPFKIPVTEIFVEMLYAAEESNDLVNVSATSSLTNPQDRHGVLRIHIFDKANTSYTPEVKILKGNDTFYESTEPVQSNNIFQKNYIREIPGQRVVTSSRSTVTKILNPENLEISLRDQVARMVSRNVPSIFPYSNSSNVIDVNVQTQDDQLLASAQMIGHNKGRYVDSSPDGSGINNMPMRVIPVTMNMVTVGCPLINFAQQFFVDMRTGTTIDNIYGIISIDHDFSPGSFRTSLSLTPMDAYGEYETAQNFIDYVENIANKLKETSAGTSSSQVVKRPSSLAPTAAPADEFIPWSHENTYRLTDPFSWFIRGRQDVSYSYLSDTTPGVDFSGS